MQFHGGVYRSDDAGASWIDVGEGLPSDFGFPIVIDPVDPDSAYVIPHVGAEDRTPPDGIVRVWETRDAGANWQPRGEGLPGPNAYLTVLREAFDSAGQGDGLELYFGATSGEVFGSTDAGATWSEVGDHLPDRLLRHRRPRRDRRQSRALDIDVAKDAAVSWANVWLIPAAISGACLLLFLIFFTTVAEPTPAKSEESTR